MIATCSCTHAAQDSLHGKGKRVHNFSLRSKRWRCTVCGLEAHAGPENPKPKSREHPKER